MASEKLVFLEVSPSDHPRYKVFTFSMDKDSETLLSADSKSELRLKMAVAGLAVECCISRPLPLGFAARWSRFRVSREKQK